MAAINRHTPIETIEGLTLGACAVLAGRAISFFADFEAHNLTEILAEIRGQGSSQDAKALFAALVRSGVSINLEKSTPISDLGVLSNDASQRLIAAGYKALADFEGAFFPKIHKLIGYGRSKPLLIAIVSAGIEANFRKPDFSETDWRDFMTSIVEQGLVSWEDVASAVLAELNPPQVGTAVANAVKHNYPKGKTMQEVWTWLYGLDGKCSVSGKRLFLEADHITPKDDFAKAGKDTQEADTLENFQLLTKRENVIKRSSHRLGGISFSNAASVLMFVILHHRPRNLPDFEKLCREYGLTMSGIRFQEAWAMAVWLAKDGLYEID